MPEGTEGCFRLGFFLSFFGRIVSELGLLRMLPLEAAAPLGARATWGMDVTVSVSTVMVCNEASPGLPLLGLIEALDCRVVSGGGAPEAPERRSILEETLSLPLSLRSRFTLGLMVLVDEGTSDESGCDPASEVKLLSSLEKAASSAWGDPRGLASWTVSRVLLLLAGVLAPDCRNTSSLSVSVCERSMMGWGEGVARWTLMVGGSWSAFRAGGASCGLLRMGGGERNLGETGQRGAAASLDWSAERVFF